MRAYVCFDDTDTIDADRGTGKLVRWFEDELPDGCTLWGVVRQQLLVHPDIPYTSHNSSGCAVIDIPDASVREQLIERAAAHIAEHFLDGSDPGLCVALEGDAALERLAAFGRLAATTVTSQDAAREAADGVHLSGHGGTNDGIIGAAAGVGLTAWGWAGRFVEYRSLRGFPDPVPVGALEDAEIIVLPIDRNIGMPCREEVVTTAGWLRPRLWGGRAGLPVEHVEPGVWRAIAPRPKKDW